MTEQTQPLLTDAELDLMLALWRLGEGSVHAVLEDLAETRPMAYTTASTIIRILEKKGFVANRKEGKAHIYAPLLTKQEYESRSLNHMVGRLFDSTPSALVARLIDDRKLSTREIKALKRMLDERG